MHGELLKARCAESGLIFDQRDNLQVGDECRCCRVPGNLRPHVVWFGEMPLEMERIYAALGDCGLFISIGTSGNVYPAAGFVQQVRRLGRARTVELNLEPSEGATLFEHARYGPASDIVPAFVEGLLTRGLAAADGD